MQKTSKTSLGQAVLLLLLSIFMALFLSEILFRIVYEPRRPDSSSLKVLIHESSPNLKLLYRPSPGMKKRAYRVYNEINKAGFRDREFPVAKPQGTQRILFLGDSVVYGYAIPGDKTFARELEKQFHEKGRPSVEVLNLGVSGYETEQAVEFFKETGLQFSPDVVIAGYTLNDSIYASMELDFFNDKVHWHIQTSDFKLYKRVLHFIYKHSHLLQYLDKRLDLFKGNEKVQSYLRGEKTVWHFIRDRNRKVQDPADSPYQQLKAKILEDARKAGTPENNLKQMLSFVGIDNYVMSSSHWNVSKKSFEELKQLSEVHSFRTVVIIFPFMIDPEHYALGGVHEFVRKELEGLGITVIDLKDFAFEAYRQHGRALMQGDPTHFSPLGTALISEYLYQKLSETI